MESLALARPVVSTFVAGIPELVDNTCGWLVPAGDSIALADAMAAALSSTPADLDPDRLACGRRGERIVQNHDASTEAARLASLFRPFHFGRQRGRTDRATSQTADAPTVSN